MHWPTCLDPIYEPSSANNRPRSQISDQVNFPFVLDFPIATAIACLLFSGGPSAIARLIVPSVVNAVDRVIAAWSRPHVRKKCLEAFQPFIAHPNSAPPIVLVCPIGRVVAAALNLHPNVKFW